MPTRNSETQVTAGAPSIGLRRNVGSRIFLLHDPEKVWLIRSGAVDVFLVPIGPDGEFGTRCPVAHLEAGQAIFGFHPAERGDLAIIASPGPDTELAPVSLRSLGGPDANGAEPGALLDAWVSALYASVASTTRPSSFLYLAPGETFSISAQGSAVTPPNGVLWVQHLQGCSHFLERDLDPIDSSSYFPISKRGWLFAAGNSLLHSIDSKALIEEEALPEALPRFHRVILKYLWVKQREAEEHFRTRLQTTAKADAALVEDALHQLCVSSPDGRRSTSHGTGSIQESTFLACQAAGAYLGIEIKPNTGSQPGWATSRVVEGIARASSSRLRRVALSDLWWKYDSGPMVAFYESDSRAVALLPRRLSGYKLYDPVERRSWSMNATLAAKLQPFAYCLYRSLPAKSITVPDLITFGLRSCKQEMAMILLTSVAAGLLGMITPLCTALIFDSVIPSADRLQLVHIAVFLVACAISSGLFVLARGMLMLRLQIKMNSPLQAAVWDRLLSLPLPFFRDYNSGDLAQRTMGFDQIRQKLTGPTFTTIMSAIFSTFNFVLLFYYSSELALIALLLTAIAVAAASFFAFVQLRLFRQTVALMGKLSGLVVQLISGIAKLRVSGSEHRAFAAWAQIFGKQERLSFRRQEIAVYQSVWGTIFGVACSIVIYNFAAAAFATAGASPTSSALTPGQFLAFSAAFGSFMGGMLQLNGAISLVLSIVPLYERSRSILQTLPEPEEKQTSPGVLSGSIEVSHVSFRYRPDLPLVLKDVSFRVEPGQFVAIVGSSGSGKSTILRLLIGFEKPEGGAVYYDGQDLSGLVVREVRQQMGVVLQGGLLMRGSIFRNVIGSLPLPLSDAMEAVRLAGIEDDIKMMPMGMHTLLGEGGEGLSGGQRQRLMIARAIVRKPRILLFDEATSALDNESQALVSRSLESLDATRVVIAHRLSTIINADRIFVLENGVLAQSGTYAELMNEEGAFKELASRQIV